MFSNPMSFGQTKSRKTNPPTKTSPSPLISELLSLQKLKLFFDSCPHIKIQNEKKIPQITNILSFERDEYIKVDDQTFRSIRLSISRILTLKSYFILSIGGNFQKSGKGGRGCLITLQKNFLSKNFLDQFVGACWI